MTRFVVACTLMMMGVGVGGVGSAPDGPPPWAYPVNASSGASVVDDGGARRVPGSAAAFTPLQIRDPFNVPDWHPGDHPPMAAAVLLSAAPIPLAGQSQTTEIQTYKAAHTPDGLPNLQGVWQALNTAAWDIQDHHASWGIPAGQGVVQGNDIPYRPAALAKREENFENRKTADPVSKCYLPGVPRITYMPFPFQIFQTARKVAITYEYIHSDRIIYTDGSSHPDPIVDFWMGDSRGHYEGDTLVVDVANINDQTWFDAAGNFHSDALHLVERYTPIGPDHLSYEVTIEDPKVFTRPWKMSMVLYRRKEPSAQILEYECYAYALEERSRK